MAREVLKRARRESVGEPADSPVHALLEELGALPGVPGDWSTADAAEPVALLPMQFQLADLTLSWFSTIATFDTPRDVTLQELRIESFFPADTETEQLAHAMAD